MARPYRIRPSGIPQTGGMAASAVATVVLLFTPMEVLERVVALSGLAAIAPVAESSLGSFRRAALILLGGGGAAALAWGTLFVLLRVFGRGSDVGDLPEVRSADTHPDAPTRKPLTVAELAVPLTRQAAEPDEDQAPPCDLDQPLAAFDPDAIPSTPHEPTRPAPSPKSRREPLRPGERIESFEISQRHAAETGAPSIEALLARLDRGTTAWRPEVRRAG